MAVLLHPDILQSVKIENVKIKSVKNFLICLIYLRNALNSSRKSINKNIFDFYIAIFTL